MIERSVFHLISELTQKEGVSCVLIGGFAVNHYGVSRQTADVDYLITKEDFDKILPHLEKTGYQQLSSQDNFAQLKSSHLPLMDIDFMFVEKETFGKVLKEAQQLTIVSQKFKVPSLNHLIALKLHAIKHNSKIRLIRDFPDIINLIRINKVAVKNNQFKELCLKFGTEEIYQRILETLK